MYIADKQIGPSSSPEETLPPLHPPVLLAVVEPGGVRTPLQELRKRGAGVSQTVEMVGEEFAALKKETRSVVTQARRLRQFSQQTGANGKSSAVGGGARSKKRKTRRGRPFNLHSQWKKMSERLERLAVRAEQLRLDSIKLNAQSHPLFLLCWNIRTLAARERRQM
jgi:hypothetical protein